MFPTSKKVSVKKMSTEIERKFLIEKPDENMLLELDGAVRSEIVQTYLVNTDGMIERVRRRDFGTHVVYYHTRKKRLSAMSAFEDESEITENEYQLLLQRADESKKPIVKTRWAIPFCGHTAEIDIYPFWKHQAVLEIEQESESIELPFPPYLSLIREVTGDHAYSNNQLSKSVPEEDLFAFTKDLSRFSGRPSYDGSGDIFVSVDGSDEYDGSIGHPFATLERAVRAVSERDSSQTPVTVAVMKGTYTVQELTIGKDCSGTENAPVTFRPFGDGEVVLNASVRLDPARFDTSDGKVYSCRLDPALIPDAGMLYPVGSHGSWGMYDSHVPGINRELYLNGKRMQLSRYPKEGYLHLAGVIDAGECLEYPVHCIHEGWREKRNPRPGEYMMDPGTARRVRGWKHAKDIWTFGYFGYDWASASCPVTEFDTVKGSFVPEFVSMFGVYEGARYCFLNVADELSDGEWYIDRETATLYIRPGFDIGNADIELGGKTCCAIRIDGAEHLHIEGFTVQGARGNAIEGHGNHICLSDLIVRQSSGNGIVLSGTDNRVYGCELYDLGEGGIVLDGGDRITLTPGNSAADNNSIHDFGYLFPSYRPGVLLKGVGNRCIHNEIFNCPHCAVQYGGNDLVIEYNVIHDAVTASTDAGAVYCGRDWTKCGCVVAYNCLYRIGGEDSFPDGIYFDDLISGQTAHHNLIVDVGKYGFIAGGGRDIVISDNIVASCGKSCIDFDSRGRDAYLFDGWAKDLVCGNDKPLWKNLHDMPYDGKVWIDHYPQFLSFTEDASDPDDPRFALNPAGGHVTRNRLIAPSGAHTRIFPDVFRFSTVEGNIYAKSTADAGISYGTFRFPDGTAPIPLKQIGRY